MLHHRLDRAVLAALLTLLAPAVAAAAPAHGAPAKHAPAGKDAHGALKNVGHGGKTTAKLEPPASRHVPARSVGSPTDGHLVNGARLADAPYLRIVPVYAPGDVRFGVDSLVGLIDRSAQRVRKQFPDAVLSVGHLSRAGGGELDRHASHESGRDADIGFYIRNQQNKPLYADHFVPFKGDGTAASWPGAHFDDARNWTLVASIAGDGLSHVTHIFVATPLRARLLEYAAKIGAPQNIRNRAAELMMQPKGALPHDDHFHVRVACPHGMDKCVELPIAKHHPHGGAPAQVAHHEGGHGDSHAAAGHAPAHAASAHAAAHPAASARPHAAPPKPAPAPAKPKADDTESAKNESLVPSLAPLVPGYGSAVIPTPLTPTEKPAPQPAPPVIDDPDGVLPLE